MRPLLLFGLCHALVASASIYDWPNVLGTAPWLFDQGSTHGYRLEGPSIRGPAPDWALGNGDVPLIQYQGQSDEITWDPPVATDATAFPGSILVAAAERQLHFTAQLAFESANFSLIRMSLENRANEPTWSWFNITGAAVNITTSSDEIQFALPKPSMTCFPESLYSGGRLIFVKSHLLDGELQPLQWNVKVKNASHFEATSAKVQLPAGQSFVAFAMLAHLSLPALRPNASACNRSFSRSLSRWDGYLQTVLRDASTGWTAVKSIMTLMGNWRAVPGKPPGVLPSYVGYEGGFWSWDTYKQAVGMVHFAPQLAKDQLRLLVSARDSSGHIPDKVDRCGQGGGCSGKPPLLAWAVWEVFQKTQDLEFLLEMYPVVRDFHHFWYKHRDVTGTGLCSWTEGMESGMDDGVRFQPQFARSVSNASTQVT